MSTAFRPSLTLAELKFILDRICASDDPIAKPIMSKLEVLLYKAKKGYTKPSHLKIGSPSKAAQLGFEEDTTIEKLLEAWKTDPLLLSSAQRARVAHHRYLNDMMSAAEEASYEQLGHIEG